MNRTFSESPSPSFAFALESRRRHCADELGFVVDWCERGIIAKVSRGRAHLMRCEGDEGHVGGRA